jgi:peptide/nickel transport system permease protein
MTEAPAADLLAGTATLSLRRAGHPMLRRLLRQKGFVISASVLAVIVLAALLGPLLLPGDPLKVEFRMRFHPPSLDLPFGADHYGRSVFTRVIWGAHLSLFIGVMVVLITGICGTLIGAAAGYFRRLDNVVMRLMDALMAFPSLKLAIAIAAALGTGLENLIIALGVAYTPRTARVARAAVIVVKGAEYVESARLSGASDIRILWRHILPNSMAPLIVELTFIFAYAVLAEAALSFLGVGPAPPTPTWGNIIAEGRDYVFDAPWITVFPGIAISLTVLALNLLGDGLRDVLDPRLKST